MTYGDATRGAIRNAAKNLVKACTEENGKVKGGLVMEIGKHLQCSERRVPLS